MIWENAISALDCGVDLPELHLPRGIVHEFTIQAESEYPHECCGFLLGARDSDKIEVREYARMSNSQKDNRERRFLIPPEEFLRIDREADAKGLSIVGIVHSHPDHPDKPSEFDKTHAWPGISYVIVSVSHGKAESFRSWELSNSRNEFMEEGIVVMQMEREN